jgi:aspartate carbamoyltransferase regulatory subunit
MDGMTIEEAIKHCEEVADTCEYEASKYDMTDAYERSVACKEGECASEHRQLAEWLRELKDYKDARVGCEYCKHNFREQHERPCSLCQRNFMDMFEREVNADDTNRCEN